MQETELRTPDLGGTGLLGLLRDNLGDAAIPRSEIEAQLAKILASPGFDVPDRIRRFLKYIVTESLEGRSDQLKAYVIAMEVLGRSADFDAQSDPIVRVEAGKLRMAVGRYYATAGRADPIWITIPKGRYIPTFNRIDGRTTALANGAWRFWFRKYFVPVGLAALLLVVAIEESLRGPSTWMHFNVGGTGTAKSGQPYTPLLVVEPLRDLTSTRASAAMAAGLTEELIDELARFHEIEVVVANPQEPSGAINAVDYYILSGTVTVDSGNLRLLIRLADRQNGSVLWSGSYQNNLQVSPLLDIQSEIASEIATALGQPYGVVFQASARQRSEPEDWQSYNCVLSYYAYRRTLGAAGQDAVRSCLEATVSRFPRYATAWALLAITRVDEQRFRFYLNPNQPPDFSSALDAATHATTIDPTGARGLEAEMLARYFSGQKLAALAVGARAVQINPNDTELVGEYGIRLAFSGEWDAGCKLIQQSLDRNQNQHEFYELPLAVCAYMGGDYETARQRLIAANVGGNPMHHFVAAAVYGQLNATADAEREKLWLTTNAGWLVNNLRTDLSRRFGREKDIQHLVDGMVKAGIKVPSP